MWVTLSSLFVYNVSNCECHFIMNHDTLGVSSPESTGNVRNLQLECIRFDF